MLMDMDKSLMPISMEKSAVVSPLSTFSDSLSLVDHDQQPYFATNQLSKIDLVQQLLLVQAPLQLKHD